MRLVAQGLSHGEVAQALGLKHSTVRNHMAQSPNGLYSRIGASSQCHALAILIRDGYITAEELQHGNYAAG